MIAAIAALLLAQNIIGGGSVNGASVQSATTAALTFYVDPAGNNANTCTASGAGGACATLAGVLPKIPQVINHNVTVNIAAGAYAAPFILSTPFRIANGATLTFTGAQTTFTPATGTSSGTTTAAAAGSTSGPATMTDSGQSWTTSDLVGRYVLFGSGALSGQAFPITANTGTTITIPMTTSPGTGSTYTIVDNTSTFISATAASIVNVSGDGVLALTNLWIERTSGITMTTSASVRITATNVSVRSASTAWFQSAGLATPVRSYFSGVSGYATQTSSTVATMPAVFRATNCSFKGTTSSGVQLGTGSGLDLLSGSTVESSTGSALSVVTASSATATNLWVSCSSTGTGITVGSAMGVQGARASSFAGTSGSFRISGCTTGVLVYGYSYAHLAAPTLANLTTGISVLRGGVYDLNNDGITFSTVTNELSYDGTNVTLAALDALAAPKIFTNNYGSRLIR